LEDFTMQFDDTRALITGGGRGLGAALAMALAAAGAHVVVAARTAAEIDGVVAHIRRQGGIAHALVADIADKMAVHPLAAASAALIGPINLLIHAAGSLGPVPLRLLADTDCEDLETALAVNLVGPFRLTKAIVGNMALHGRGTVLHITTDAAVEAYPTWGAYGVSKAAVDHLNRTWAAELGELGVRFLAVDPGEMATRMHAEALPDADPATLADPAAVAARLLPLLLPNARVNTGDRLVLAHPVAV
jgi:NAD(P)-dependent dehydrogenase (short-subunit alcohol dehydrogenase family)